MTTVEPTEIRTKYLPDGLLVTLFPAGVPVPRCVLVDGQSYWPREDDTPPRSWSLPPEPGPEVTAVRAAQSHYGMTLWVREPLAWNLRRADGKLIVSCTKWLRLLQRYGPLTDASGETP